MTTVPSSSAALTVFSHSACHAGLESAAMEVFGDETPRQNSRVQRNAMMNRVGSDKRILLFSEVIPDSAAFISCLEPSQEELVPAPGWPWRGLESDWSDAPDRGARALLVRSIRCLLCAGRGSGFD